MDGTTRTTRDHAGGLSKPLNNKATTDDFWKFCLQHHNKPEVQQACLTLQEMHKGNINIALLLTWLEYGEYSLSKSSLEALRQSIKKTEPLLRRYRLLRREIKPQLSKGAYQKMLNFELVLEKTQQQDLIECLNRQTWHSMGHSTLQYYCKKLDPDAQFLYPQFISRLIPATDTIEASHATQTIHSDNETENKTNSHSQTIVEPSSAISPSSNQVYPDHSEPNTHSDSSIESNVNENSKPIQEKQQLNPNKSTKTQLIFTAPNELEYTL